MRTIDPRRSLGIGLAVLSAAAIAPLGAVRASNVNVQGTAYQTVKGWGGFSFIYQVPTAAEATVVANLGINVGRIEVRPELRNSDGSWNTSALAMLEGWVGASRNSGVASYMLDVWSPPAVWKTTGNTNTGGLASGQEQTFANWYVSVIQKLQADGYGTPIAISAQNEPNVDTGGAYYMCQYNTPSQLFTVQADLRSALASHSLSSVKVMGVESSGYCEWQPGCGADYMGSDPFTALTNTSYLNSMDAYCVHSYDKCGIVAMQDGMARYPKEAWETEFSYPFPDQSSEIAMAVSTARDMMADLETLPFNYWFWWSLWDPSTANPSPTALIGQNGSTTTVGARYYMLQKIWKTVTPGWITLHCTTDDSQLLSSTVGQNCGNNQEPLCDMLAWKNAAGTNTAVLIANQYAASKTISVNGLLGATATFYRTSSTENMAQVSSGAITGGSYSITLPANSVGFVVTSGTGGGGNPTFTGTASASPSTVAPNANTTITVTFTDTGAALTNGVADLEIYNSSGTRVTQQAWTGQNWSAGQKNTYTYTWTAPSTPGTYTMELGVFNSTWATNYYWNSNAGTITVSAGDSAQYNFESGVQAWTFSAAPITGVSSSTTQHFAGTHALAVTINGAAGQQQALVNSPATGAGQTITFHVWVPSGSQITSIQPYEMDNVWAWTGSIKTISQLTANAWNTVTVTVPANAAMPLQQLGVQFTTGATWNGTCYIDSVSW